MYAAKKMDWQNNLSAVCEANSGDWQSEWSRKLVWCFNRFALHFSASSIKKGKKCVKRSPLTGWLFAHWKSGKKPFFRGRQKISKWCFIGSIREIITVSASDALDQQMEYWSNSVWMSKKSVLPEIKKKIRLGNKSGKKMIFLPSKIQKGCSLLIYMCNWKLIWEIFTSNGVDFK